MTFGQDPFIEDAVVARLADEKNNAPMQPKAERYDSMQFWLVGIAGTYAKLDGAELLGDKARHYRSLLAGLSPARASFRDEGSSNASIEQVALT